MNATNTGNDYLVRLHNGDCWHTRSNGFLSNRVIWRGVNLQ
jgi:hypothetical protein